MRRSLRRAISRTVIDVNRDPDLAKPRTRAWRRRSSCPRRRSMACRYTNGAELRTRRTSAASQALLRSVSRGSASRARAHPATAWQCRRLRRAFDSLSRAPARSMGELPIFNIGTFDGRSCSPDSRTRSSMVCAGSTGSYVVNGRFKGGWITRHYGRPAQGVHAVQMELACRAYMPMSRMCRSTRATGRRLFRRDGARRRCVAAAMLLSKFARELCGDRSHDESDRTPRA